MKEQTITGKLVEYAKLVGAAQEYLAANPDVAKAINVSQKVQHEPYYESTHQSPPYPTRQNTSICVGGRLVGGF